MNKHTQTPWTMGEKHPCRIFAKNPTGNMGREIVGSTCWPDNEGSETEREIANAVFIVRACNAHEDLLEACLMARPTLQQITHDDPHNIAAKNNLKYINAAIARAGGGGE